MLFSYKKLRVDGEQICGQQEFDSFAEAQNALIETGELLLELKAVSSIKTARLSLQQKLDFTYQMHQLIAAGLPIYESLISLKEKKSPYQGTLQQIAEKIKEGKTLSWALKQHPGSFDQLYVAIIQASEATGEIEGGFFALKILLEKQAKLIKILKNAFIYPLILLFFAFVIVNGLIFFIIPSLSELFEGREVNGLTAFILDLSHFCLDHVLSLFLSFMALIAGCVYLSVKGLLKRFLLTLTQGIPFCQNLVMSLKFENFFACLGLLLSRGVTLKEALQLSRNVLGHPALEKVVDAMIADILMGKKLSDSLNPPFPSVAKRLIALSEVTGQMASSCHMLSTLYQEEVEKKLQQLTAFLQPILLALIGLIIGVVILSILMPLTDVGGFI